MAGKVTVSLALQWLCITAFSSLSTYGLNALARQMTTRLHSSKGYGTVDLNRCVAVDRILHHK